MNCVVVVCVVVDEAVVVVLFGSTLVVIEVSVVVPVPVVVVAVDVVNRCSGYIKSPDVTLQHAVPVVPGNNGSTHCTCAGF